MADLEKQLSIKIYLPMAGLINLLNKILQVVWWFDGTYTKQKSIQEGHDKVNVAQVGRIVLRPSVSYIVPNHNRFFCWNEGFITLEQLAERNITLYNISLKHQTVSFAEFDKDYDPYNSERNPFLWMSQFHLAVRIITVPLRTFIDMMSTFDPSTMRVVFLHHTARCGSTLWCQIFSSVPDCAVISECASLARMFLQEVDDSNEFIESDEFHDIVAAAIKFHMSRFPNKKMLFVKATYGDFFISKAVARMFPDHRILFGYRDPLPSGKSWYSLSYVSGISAADVMKYWPNCPSLDNHRRVYIQGYRPCEDAIRKFKPQDPFEWYMILWCLCATLANQALASNVNIKGLKYENLVEDPRGVVGKLFQFVGIDCEHLDNAVKAMEKDSQKNSIISREICKNSKRWKQTEDSVKLCNEILAFFGFTDLHSGYTFPNDL